MCHGCRLGSFRDHSYDENAGTVARLSVAGGFQYAMGILSTCLFVTAGIRPVDSALCERQPQFKSSMIRRPPATCITGRIGPMATLNLSSAALRFATCHDQPKSASKRGLSFWSKRAQIFILFAHESDLKDDILNPLREAGHARTHTGFNHSVPRDVRAETTTPHHRTAQMKPAPRAAPEPPRRARATAARHRSAPPPAHNDVMI